MAEFHILGQLLSGNNFGSSADLFCRYSFQFGPNWTLISGQADGQTATSHTSDQDSVIWTHPIDIHLVTKGLQGWPKILLQLNTLDSLGRSWVVAYSHCSLPTVPGHHVIELPCWAPSPTSLSNRIKQYFLGGSHQLMQADVVSLGLDRFKLKTESRGTVTLDVNIILRNFGTFGIEYK